MIKIEDWVEQNNLTVTYNLPWIKVEGLGDLLLVDYKEKVFDLNFSLILSEKEYDLAENADYLLYQFGGRFYYTDKVQKPELVPFKYVGKINTIYPQPDVPFLGIHGGYDLCNGSRTYSEWCKKAKFVGITTLGIAEENTLAGVLSFQEACEKYKIKSIVGETVTVRKEGFDDYRVKLYCKDREKGWKNLLMVNSFINVFNSGKFITEKQLLELTEGLICVLNSEVSLEHTYNIYVDSGFELYYQFDFSEWDSQDKDSLLLINMEEYLQKYMSKLKPLFISDAYYLDREDFHIRKVLNQIAGIGFKNYSKSHYFKNIDDSLLEVLEICTDDEKFLNLVIDSVINTIECFQEIGFDVVTHKFYLPKYIMSETEALQFQDTEVLFRHYIERGFKEKVLDRGLDENLYRERVERELDVIKRGGFIDYFLIILDLYRFADTKGIWYGIGRGSAGGVLVSYLTGITGVDPIEYDLLFERFLNEGRLDRSLPDIDTDWSSAGREEVKLYLEEKYGRDSVTAIGTYGTFKLKNTTKDVARVKGVDASTVNYITNFLTTSDGRHQQFQHYYEFFHCAVDYNLDKNKQLLQFIEKYPHVVSELPLLMNQPKNASIHAAGIVIVPREFGTLYEQLPVKLQKGILVSEWEGIFIDKAGFVKLDILGINQFDKFGEMSRLIKENTGKEITYKDISLDDEKVFDLFRKGYNEDIFQLGGLGLKSYCKLLQPNNIEDLIATIALYRPGPIESGAHLKYVKRKNGEEEPVSDPGCEKITEKTYGLIVYQEQTMQICQHVGGFSLVEADDVRKALGKMKQEVIAPYKEVFISRSVEKGYNEEDMVVLWNKMEAFAMYAFNRSHSACYAITGYYSQWFKANYPLEFWTTSLQFSETHNIQDKISEIKNGKSIDITSVSINYSGYVFRSDVKTNTIYWALPSVKYVGDKLVESIIQEREKNGLFFSLEEFYERLKENKPNKRAMYYLIISGAFDSIENIKFIEQRYDIMEKFSSLIKDPLKEEYLEMKNWREYQWTLKEKEFTGFGFFNFKELITNSDLGTKMYQYKDNVEILLEDLGERGSKSVLVSGLVEEVVRRNSKKGEFVQLQLRDNTESLYITIWNETYKEFKDEIDSCKNKVVVFSGVIEFDSYKHRNVVKSTGSSKIEVL